MKIFTRLVSLIVISFSVSACNTETVETHSIPKDNFKMALADAHSMGLQGKDVKIAVVEGHSEFHANQVKNIINKVSPKRSYLVSLETADVVNMSIESEDEVEEWKEEMSLLNPNAIVVVAAGNQGLPSEENTVAVAASSVFPNTSLVVGVTEKYSNRPGALSSSFVYAPEWTGQGTSFAAPVVSGTAGLLISACPNSSPAQITSIVKDIFNGNRYVLIRNPSSDLRCR